MPHDPAAHRTDPRRLGGPPGANLVRMGASSPQVGKNDLFARVDRSSLPAGGFIGVGLVLAGTGIAVASLGVGGFIFGAAISCMITLGGGLTFLGVMKSRRAEQASLPPVQEALAAAPGEPPPPRTDPTVLAERGRRVSTALAGGGEATFEALRAELKWTQPALLETLLWLKENGAIEEDLNLDTGVWVYRTSTSSNVGDPQSLMLEDRVPRG